MNECFHKTIFERTNYIVGVGAHDDPKTRRLRKIIFERTMKRVYKRLPLEGKLARNATDEV